ncbi:MAG: hypothetical protein WC292_00160 [Clostridia bacterium]
MANKKLLNAFKLSSKITIYIPGTKNINEAADTTEHVDDCARLLSECFGGATSTPALGYWASPTAGLVKEQTTMVFAYCKEADLEAHLARVIDYCISLKAELNQEAIALELNGEMYFI